MFLADRYSIKVQGNKVRFEIQANTEPHPPRRNGPAGQVNPLSADEQSEELAQILKWFGSEFKWDDWKGGDER